MIFEGSIIGGGGYGIVIDTKNTSLVAKLLYEVHKCDELYKEAAIQKRAREILLQNKIDVKVPEITDIFSTITTYKDKKYLCGIIMEKIIPPEDFDEQVHIILGYTGNDINDICYVCNSKIPRGFYADAKMIEAIGGNIKEISYNMGRALKTLLINGIIPTDIEFIIDKDLQIWMIDFGLCEEAIIDPIVYLNKKGVVGLKDDIYVPHENMQGYESFIKGYMF